MSQEDLNARAELDAVYLTIEEAKEEIQKRWNDVALRKRVEEFLGNDVPEVFRDVPKAVIGRQILSPNYELIDFEQSAHKIGLKPVCFGYLDDKLVTKNLDKYYLCKLFFEDGIGRHGGERISLRKVLDFNEYNGGTFREAQTNFGMSFVEFHQRLAHDFGANVDFYDGSGFLQRHGQVSEKYYKYFLSLFVCHGVLFENYLLEGEYGKLTQDVFLPNYSEVKKLFGVNPIIVRLTDVGSENDIHWRYYPIAISDVADKIIHSWT